MLVDFVERCRDLDEKAQDQKKKRTAARREVAAGRDGVTLCGAILRRTFGGGRGRTGLALACWSLCVSLSEPPERW